MKLIKLFIPAVAAVMMALTSCSDKGYWDKYTAPTANYSFVAEKQSYSFEGNMPEYVTVYVNRSNTGAAASVPVTLQSTTAEITGANEVQFAAGQAQAEYHLMLGSGLKCGVNNVAKITLDGDVEDFNIGVTQITIYREYSFSPLGEGWICSPEAFEYEWPVDVEKANEDSHVFRIQDPYYIMYDDENAQGLANMVITCNDDFTVAVFKTFSPGFSLQGYDIKFGLADYGYIAGDEIFFPINWDAYEDGTYAGSFGVYTDSVVMPEGWNQ